MDQLQCRSLPTQEPAHGPCRETGLLATGDFVAHQPQGVDLLRQIPAVLTGPAPQGGNAVTQLPRPQRRHRHAQHLDDILDRKTPRIPERDMFTGRRLHATLSIARPIRRRFYASRVLIPTIGPYHPPAGAWSKSAIQPSSRARRWGDSGPTRCSTDTTGSPPGASVRAFPCRAPWWHPGSLHQGRRRRSPEIR